MLYFWSLKATGALQGGGGRPGLWPRVPRFWGRQIEKKIYTRYSEVGFTTKKKGHEGRKITNFSGKRAQILCSTPGDGYPRYAPEKPLLGIENFQTF